MGGFGSHRRKPRIYASRHMKCRDLGAQIYVPFDAVKNPDAFEGLGVEFRPVFRPSRA